ncbi:response regulator [Ancylomarina sp. YFZ004]
MRKILAIDDNADNLVVYKAILKPQYSGCNIITCQSGKKGIKIAEEKQPDVILLDILMPDLDGFATCEKLKNNSLTKHIPIILITAMRGDNKSRIKGLQIGADAFISKPIEEDELVAQINVMLRIKDAEDELREKNKDLEVDVKQKISELETSQRTLNNLLNNLPGFAYQCLNNRDWSMTYISDGCKEITGYSPDDFISKNTITFNDIIHPDYREKLWNKWQVTLTQKSTFQAEYPIINAKGETKWIWEQGSGVFKGDNLIYIEGFITDITQRKISEDKFRKIFDQSPIGIALVDSHSSQIIQVNDKYCQILERSENELTQSNWQNMTHPDDIQQDLYQMDLLNTGKINGFSIEKRLLKSNGEYIWVILTTTRINILSSDTPCHLAMIKDITERKNLTQSLISAKENAEESDRLKSVFLATMSHELRTPLNAVIGFSELIEKDLPIDEITYFSEIINTSGKHLLGIIEDIFDISLIETGDLKIHREPLNLLALLDDIHQVIKNEQTLQNKENINLIFNNQIGSLDLVLFSDQKRIKQILLNLLKNALKFTNKGTVEFGCIIIEMDKKPFVKFFVKDTGIGVPKEKRDFIFEVFRQADDSHSRIYGGTGLGLTISKKLTNLMGGEIWLEPGIDQGTNFYFTIPTHINSKEKEVKKDAQDSYNLKGKIVLIAEDDKVSFSFLNIFLSSKGMKCIWVKDGQEAVEYCKGNDKIDILLMDIHMPNMNGYIATDIIKKIRPNLPIIAQTAYAIAGDEKMIRDAGCDFYVSKPINKEDLLSKMNHSINKLNTAINL